MGPNVFRQSSPGLEASRVAGSVAPLHRRCEPSKDLVSQSLSSKLTCERERWLKRLLNSCSQLRTRSRERERDQLTRLLTSCSQLTARSRERERDQLTRLLNSCSQLRARSRERSAHKALDLLLTAQSAFEREISLQGCHKFLLHLGEFCRHFM